MPIDPAGAPAADKRSLFIIIAALIVVTLALYSRIAGFNFVEWDDPGHITESPDYHPTRFAHLAQIWTTNYFSEYLPLPRTVWAVLADQSVGASGAPLVTFDPTKYHMVNLYVHTASVVLVFLILRLFVKKDWAAGLGALFFAVQPLQVEPVAWVSGLRDLLCGLFAFIAILCYFKGTQRGAMQWPWLVGSSAAYVLALLSKSAAAVLPAILILLDLVQAGRLPLRRLILPAAWLLPALAIIIITKRAEEGATAANLMAGLLHVVPVWQRPFVACDTVSFYLWKLFVPCLLGPDYGRTPIWVMSHAWAYATILVPIGLVVLAWRFWKLAPWLSAGIGIFLLSVAPVSGIIPFVFQAISTVADRYMYFAMLGPAMVFAGLLSLIPWRPAVAAGSVLLVCLVLLTSRQIPVWTNTITLFTQGLRVNPHSWVSYTSLASQMELAGHLDDAIAENQTAIRVNPDYWQPQYNLALELYKKWALDGRKPDQEGLLMESKDHLDQCIRVTGGYEPAVQSLGRVYLRLNRIPEAVVQYEKAIQECPTDPENYVLLAVAYARRQETSQAIAYMKLAAHMGYAPAIHALTLPVEQWN